MGLELVIRGFLLPTIMVGGGQFIAARMSGVDDRGQQHDEFPATVTGPVRHVVLDHPDQVRLVRIQVRARAGGLDDPVPAGTYSGTALNAMQNVKFNGRRNGARGPDYFQADVRAGWRRQLARGNALEIFLDIYNITNRTNFLNPVDLTTTGGASNRDARIPATFLVLTNLYGGGGFPRQAQLGVRYVF